MTTDGKNEENVKILEIFRFKQEWKEGKSMVSYDHSIKIDIKQ